MDDIDRAILNVLQREARIANNELAERVGLSPSPCLRRVRALEASGVIESYAAILDADKLDCGYSPIVWVTLDAVTRATMTEFEGAVAEIDHIVEALRMMGHPDYLLRIALADAAAFEAFYIDVLAGLPHVQKLTSQLAMTTVKRSHTLPIRT